MEKVDLYRELKAFPLVLEEMKRTATSRRDADEKLLVDASEVESEGEEEEEEEKEEEEENMLSSSRSSSTPRRRSQRQAARRR